MEHMLVSKRYKLCLSVTTLLLDTNIDLVTFVFTYSLTLLFHLASCQIQM